MRERGPAALSLAQLTSPGLSEEESDRLVSIEITRRKLFVSHAP